MTWAFGSFTVCPIPEEMSLCQILWGVKKQFDLQWQETTTSREIRPSCLSRKSDIPLEVPGQRFHCPVVEVAHSVSPWWDSYLLNTPLIHHTQHPLKVIKLRQQYWEIKATSLTLIIHQIILLKQCINYFIVGTKHLLFNVLTSDQYHAC